MKPSVIIALLLSFFVLRSNDCAHKVDGPFLVGNWDYKRFIETRDSSLQPLNNKDSSIFFAPFSKNSYQFSISDSVIYTDYTVTPNIVKYGAYQFVNCTQFSTSGIIVLLFPSEIPDTLSFTAATGLAPGGNSNINLVFGSNFVDNGITVYDSRIYSKF
jgi:hypothetical protein